MDYITLRCKDQISIRIKDSIKKIQNKGFDVYFNGNNFDIIDNNGNCINDESGLSLDMLEEYSLLNHYYIIGEKVKITYSRLLIDEPYLFDDETYIPQCFGVIEGFGEAIYDMVAQIKTNDGRIFLPFGDFEPLN